MESRPREAELRLQDQVFQVRALELPRYALVRVCVGGLELQHLIVRFRDKCCSRIRIGLVHDESILITEPGHHAPVVAQQ